MTDSAPLDPAFPKGRFHLSQPGEADWRPGLRGHFAYRDLGVAAATRGKVLAQVIKATQASAEPGDTHLHRLDFQMVYMLKGWARMRFDGVGEVRLEAGSCWYQEPGIHHSVIEYSDDFELLEITVPADFETVSLDEPAADRAA